MKSDRITLQRLYLFTEVARRRSLNAASEYLRVSQPSISVQIRLLEKELDAKLWKKNGQGIELTAAGNLLLSHAARILRRVEVAKSRVRREFGESPTPALNVGGSQMACLGLLPELLRSFKKDHPELQINLRTGDGTEVARMLFAGEIDLAIVNGFPNHRDIAREPFGIDVIIACVSRNHPLASKTVLTQGDIDAFGIITRRLDDTGRSARFIELLESRGFVGRVAIECDSSASKRAAGLNQLGIALIFRSVVQEQLASGELVELKIPGGDLYRESSLVYRRRRRLPPPAAEFLKLLREHRSAMDAERRSRLNPQIGSALHVPGRGRGTELRP